MSMIVIHHFLYHGHISQVFSIQWINQLEAFVIFGVDIFIMISGYFSIKLTARNFFSLAFTVFIFSAINLLIPYLLNKPLPEGCRNIIDITLFPLSRNEYWFIQLYAGLLVLSPLLNSAIHYLDRPQFTKLVGILIAFNCYGHFIGSNMGDGGGMSLFMFITCYYTGALIRKWQDELQQFQSIKIISLTVTSIAFVILFDCIVSNRFSYFLIFKYSSPYVIGVSACMIILFSRIRLQNPLINLLGASSLGVYLLQDGVIGTYIYRYINELQYPTGISLVILIGLFTAYWICSVALTIITKTSFQFIFDSIIHLHRSLLSPRIKTLIKI